MGFRVGCRVKFHFIQARVRLIGFGKYVDMGYEEAKGGARGYEGVKRATRAGVHRGKTVCHGVTKGVRLYVMGVHRGATVCHGGTQGVRRYVWGVNRVRL